MGSEWMVQAVWSRNAAGAPLLELELEAEAPLVVEALEGSSSALQAVSAAKEAPRANRIMARHYRLSDRSSEELATRGLADVAATLQLRRAFRREIGVSGARLTERAISLAGARRRRRVVGILVVAIEACLTAVVDAHGPFARDRRADRIHWRRVVARAGGARGARYTVIVYKIAVHHAARRKSGQRGGFAGLIIGVTELPSGAGVITTGYLRATDVRHIVTYAVRADVEPIDAHVAHQQGLMANAGRLAVARVRAIQLVVALMHILALWSERAHFTDVLLMSHAAAETAGCGVVAGVEWPVTLLS
jgi:hypothetical protein